MVNVRARRLGVWLLAFVSVFGAGCRHMGLPLIPSTNQSIEPRELGSQEEPDGGAQTWHRGGTRFKDQPSHLEPENIRGGIY
jgi:hypothetical protein